MKKKGLRKVLAASVAAMLMCAPMMAVNTAYAASTITITDASVANTYDVYQIFSGTVSGGTLTNLAWSSCFTDAYKTDFIGLLATSSVLKTGDNFDFTSSMSAEQVAIKLSSYNTNDDLKTIEFARIASQFFKTKGISATATVNSNDATSVDDGYYLVVNKTTGDKALSRSILKVAGTVSISGKVEYPTIDKKIGDTYSADAPEANTAAIGDKIPYVIKSTIPDMTGYNKYYYIINDTMDPGLTFNNDVVIGVDKNGNGKVDTDEKLTMENDYTVAFDSSTGKLKIVFKDFINKQKGNSAYDIITTYSATLNENAELGTTKDTANLNKVNLVYSNNPNADYKGTVGNGTTENPEYPDVPPESPRNPENPDDDTPDTPYNPDNPPYDDDNDPSTPDIPGTKFDEPVGITPYEDVVTYTTSIDLTKIDGVDSTKLAGVKFKIENKAGTTALNKVVVYSNEFVEDSGGTYYKLKNGKFTETAPSTDTSSSYASTETKYILKAVFKELDSKTSGITVEGTTTSDGTLKFIGLKEGTYVITEIEGLPGYNTISPIEITITGTVNESEKKCDWTYKKDNGTAGTTNVFTIENNKGSVLPSTGGIGTTIFYVSGGILVLGSVVLIITKKRMSLKDEK